MSKIEVTDANGKEWTFDESEAIYRKSVYGCAIFNGKVLLIRDARPPKKWELPGGGMDEGETIHQALRREIKEETGLEADVSDIKLIEQVQGFYKPLDKDYPLKTDRNYYQISVKDPESKILSAGNGDDIAECKWFDLNQIEALDMAELDKLMLQKSLGI